MTTMVFVGILVSAIVTLIVYSSYIIVIAFTIWMVVDAAKQDRFWWVVMVLGIPVVGSVAYYYTEKKHEYAVAESHHIHVAETEVQHEKTPKKLVRHRKEEKEVVEETLATDVAPENIEVKREKETV